METDNRITAILAHLRGGVVEIYAQKKLNELDKELGIQDWEDFVKEIKIMFSDKMKAADAKQKIEIFKQEEKNMADFMIEFDALAMCYETLLTWTIFIFFFLLFSDFIGILFFFSFLFRDNEEARDIAVT